MLLCRRFVFSLKGGGSCLTLRASIRAASGVCTPLPARGAACCPERWDLKLIRADRLCVEAQRRQLCFAVEDQGRKWRRDTAEFQFEMDTGLVDDVVKETEDITEFEDTKKANLGVDDVPTDKPVDIAQGEVEDDYVLVSGKGLEKQGGDAQEKLGEEAESGTATAAEEEASTAGMSRRSAFPNAEYFELTENCKLVLQAGDITEWSIDGETDAIVNAANERMLGGGGVDGAIHAAAGSGLYRACRAVSEVQPGVRCPTGQAVITDGFDLPVAKVIHTVGPVYKGRNPAALLSSAYENSMKRAQEAGLQYVCFPAISCGIYSYPHEEAAEVALETLRDNAEGLREVHFVLFDSRSQRAWFREARAKFKSLTD